MSWTVFEEDNKGEDQKNITKRSIGSRRVRKSCSSNKEKYCKIEKEQCNGANHIACSGHSKDTKLVNSPKHKI